MPIDEMPTFLKSLETYDGDQRTRLALRLMVLTFARTTELRAARWSEIENIDGNDPLCSGRDISSKLVLGMPAAAS
jgi:integrase